MDSKVDTSNTFKFKDIKEIFELKNKESFEFYLESIFPDLCSYKNNTTLGISKTKLIDFLKLPIFICEKLFDIIKESEDSTYISLNSLKNWMSKLYFGDFEETAEVIFNLYDFDHDGFIIKDDIKLMLQFLPLKTDKTKIEYKYQLESLDELDEILTDIFTNRTELNLKDFIRIVMTKSDIYLQILCFLYKKCPFQEKSIKISKKIFSNSSTNLITFSKINENEEIGKLDQYFSPIHKVKKNNTNNITNLGSPSNEVKFNSPSAHTKFSPVRDFFAKSPKSPMSEKSPSKNPMLSNMEVSHRRGSKFKKEAEKKRTSFTEKNSAELSGLKGMVRFPNEVIIEKTEDQLITKRRTVNIKKNSFSKPDIYLEKVKTIKHNDLNIANLLSEIDREKDLELIDFPEQDEQKEIEKNIIFEGLVYRPCLIDQFNVNDVYICNENKSKFTLYKQWMVLIGEEIYTYKDETKSELIKMHNLSGSLIKENGVLNIKDVEYYYFSIIFTNKTRTYLIPNKQNAKEWTSILRKTLNYHNFFDHYEIIDDLDEGHFGLVKLGVHKSTGEKVAIKIIKKGNMSEKNLGLVQTEIDILKICKHPSIVKFLDHFENSEYIFIVTEYFENGNLKKYLRRINYKMNEKVASKIVTQVCSGLKYLHNYGIVHRDIKPENIMVAHTGANFFVKILDFGLSKILGSKEKASEGCGTLLYVAPEVISIKSYNHLVDVWSLGVMLYHMLSGDFPFSSSSNQSLKEQILKQNVSFYGGIWRQRSQNVMELIKRCLEKDTKDRISIDDILNSKWMKEAELEK